MRIENFTLVGKATYGAKSYAGNRLLSTPFGLIPIGISSYLTAGLQNSYSTYLAWPELTEATDRSSTFSFLENLLMNSQSV